MNLLDERKKLLSKRKEEQRLHDREKMEALAQRIETTLSHPEVVSLLEQALVERGQIDLNEFGCLCQNSFCDWQKGLTARLTPLIEEWQKKGVVISLNIHLTMRLATHRIPSFEGQTLRQLFKSHKRKIPNIDLKP